MHDSFPPIIFEDNHLLVVNKPAGLLTQSDKSGDANLLDICREYIRIKYSKKGNVFLGMVHRLDRPVQGVIVFARTSKAAARLSEQFRNGGIDKRYLAVVDGELRNSGVLVHHLVRVNAITHAYAQPSDHSQKAELTYHSLESSENASLIDITLITGRKHQIRSQCAAIGHPIFGDRIYGSHNTLENNRIGLMCRLLSFNHPTRDERLTFTTDTPAWWPWTDHIY